MLADFFVHEDIMKTVVGIGGEAPRAELLVPGLRHGKHLCEGYGGDQDRALVLMLK